MKIIFGLGNPGREYEKNLHNLGFMAIDIVAEKLQCDFFRKTKFRSMVAETIVGGEKVILVKPLTFMNLSGEAVRAVLDFYKPKTEDILVIYDDIDIETGSIRFKPSGNSGTHNGMRNIVSCLQTTDFPRVRIGAKSEDPFIPLIEYVLSDIPKDKAELFDKAVNRAADCAVDFVRGVDNERLMNVYNTKV